MKRAVIISNGTINDYSYYNNWFSDDDYIICADGAIRHCLSLGIVPDLWIGDFDSCDYEKICMSQPQLKSVETLHLNTRKNETDTHKACMVAIERGFKKVAILGGIGTRVDHMLSNIHILEFLYNNGANTTISDEKNDIHIFDSHLRLARRRKNLSLIPLDKAVLVKSTSGLEYPLENYVLDRNISMGVSNVICSEFAEIFIENGLMLAIESDD